MTNYVIGFAEQFWTLWIAEKEPVYLIGKDGNNYLTGHNTKYSYVKNISKDLEVAKLAYPEAEVDEELRGIATRTHVKVAKEDLCPQIMKFGVYYAESIDVLVDTDLDYILWLIEERPHTPNAKYAKKHKVVLDHFRAIERKERKRKRSLAEQLDELTSNGYAIFEAQKNLSLWHTGVSNNNYGFMGVKTEGDLVYNLIFKPQDIQVYNYQGIHYALPLVNGKPKRMKGKKVKITFEHVDKIECVEMAQNQFLVTSIEFL
jgi:hypothetical protein